MPDCTKEELWAVLVAYVNHVGECEGVTFLGDVHTAHLAPRTLELLRIAEVS